MFEDNPEMPVAIVEYIGECPVNYVHGNAKTTTVSYVRKTSQQKDIIREGVKHNKPAREIRREANITDPDNVIGPKVVHDAKYIKNVTTNRQYTNQ